MTELPTTQGPPQIHVAPSPVQQTGSDDHGIYDPNAVPLPDSNGQNEDSLPVPAPPSLQQQSSGQPASSSWRPSLRPAIPQQLNFDEAEAIPVVEEDLDMSLQRALVAEVLPEEAQTQPGLYPSAGDYSPDSNTDIMADYSSPIARDDVLETQVQYHATVDQQDMDVS